MFVFYFICLGAASGIGAVTAILFAKNGAKIAIIDKNENGLKETAAKCEEASPNKENVNWILYFYVYNKLKL